MIVLAAACGAVFAVLAATRPADVRRVVATESDVRELTGFAPLTGSLAARPTAAAVDPANPADPVSPVTPATPAPSRTRAAGGQVSPSPRPGCS